jgi:site-specific recombinase XerD
MQDANLLGHWVKRFLLEHLVAERNLARNTQRSYRDAIRLLILFATERQGRAVDRLRVDDLSPGVVQAFLEHAEQERRCSIRTRNQRLAAVHAFAKFVAERRPELIPWCAEIRAIPFKRFDRPALCYLDKPEIDALLAAPDRRTDQGRRDYTLLLFLYNSGARASETAAVTLGDLAFWPDGTGSVRLHGKGAKTRHCPLWPTTMTALRDLVMGRDSSDHVFLNRRSRPITRFGIHAVVRRYVQKTTVEQPSLTKKRISPHTIRHTTATHLLRSGVDINTIRAWLGHVSIDTTNVYAEVDLETKARMLASCQVFGPNPPPKRRWRDDPDLMRFLRSL